MTAGHAGAVFEVVAAGPQVTVQDGGRPGYMRFGVPASGPMDRVAFRAANIALGNSAGAPGVEVSLGGLTLCGVQGRAELALAGGGFIAEVDGVRFGAWQVFSLEAGQRLTVRRGPWGSWTYLAFGGGLVAPEWLGSASTHLMSRRGGGVLQAGSRLTTAGAGRGTASGAIPVPAFARPGHQPLVVLGPQDRFFAEDAVAALLSAPFYLTDSYNRMGVRLRGPALAVAAPLDMPSEPILRGAIQVTGDGTPTVLLADHQTTGGYPKIATVLDADLDAFAQLRPRDAVSFRAIAPPAAVARARLSQRMRAGYEAALARRFAAG